MTFTEEDLTTILFWVIVSILGSCFWLMVVVAILFVVFGKSPRDNMSWEEGMANLSGEEIEMWSKAEQGSGLWPFETEEED